MPDQWSRVPALQTLQDLELANMTLVGTLPDSWPSAFGTLKTLWLQGNTISGRQPP